MYHMKSVCKRAFISSNGSGGRGETLTGRLYMQIFWLYFHGMAAAIDKIFERVFPYRRMQSTMSQPPRILTASLILYGRRTVFSFEREKRMCSSF